MSRQGFNRIKKLIKECKILKDIFNITIDENEQVYYKKLDKVVFYNIEKEISKK